MSTSSKSRSVVQVVSLVVVLAAGGAGALHAVGPRAEAAPDDDEPGKYVGVSECQKCHEKGMDGRPAGKLPALTENATWSSDDRASRCAACAPTCPATTRRRTPSWRASTATGSSQE